MSVSETTFESATVNGRTKISALWTSMLFAYAWTWPKQAPGASQPG